MHRLIRFVAVTAIAAATVSCGTAVAGRGASFLVIDSMLGIRGSATPGTPSATLTSDVITNVTSPAPCTATTPCPTVFGDQGQAQIRLLMRDAGSATPTDPSPINAVTLTRYHVEYVRADGRNTPGVDVPFAFDGVVSATVAGGTPATVGFSLVRVQAKTETPLVLLRSSGDAITILARVTFFGRDQAGNEVIVAGNIDINFANFGDL